MYAGAQAGHTGHPHRRVRTQPEAATAVREGLRLRDSEGRVQGPQLLPGAAFAGAQPAAEDERAEERNQRSKPGDKRAEAGTEPGEGFYEGDARVESRDASYRRSDGAGRSDQMEQWTGEGTSHSVGWNDLNSR